MTKRVLRGVFRGPRRVMYVALAISAGAWAFAPAAELAPVGATTVRLDGGAPGGDRRSGVGIARIEGRSIVYLQGSSR